MSVWCSVAKLAFVYYKIEREFSAIIAEFVKQTKGHSIIYFTFLFVILFVTILNEFLNTLWGDWVKALQLESESSRFGLGYGLSLVTRLLVTFGFKL